MKTWQLSDKIGSRLSLIVLAITLCFSLQAAPGTLADSPLFTSTFARPNIFFLVDSSGSMSYIEPSSPFDTNTTYFTCPANMQLDPATNIVLEMDTKTGYPTILVGQNTNYDWGNQSPNNKGNSKNDTRCFNNTATYAANLYDVNAKGKAGTSYPSDENGRSYSGNYLNWYFGSSPQDWGKTATQKPGQYTRLDLARQAVTAWLNSLPNSRVGLGKFNGDIGTEVLVGLDDINNNRSALLSALNDIQTVGGSPIAEAMRDIGRYFVENYNTKLILHPGKANQAEAPAYNIFNHQPNYDKGVTAASPIQYYCQGNFLLLLTDGRATGDTGIDSSTGLQDYDGDCVNATPACLNFDEKVGQSYAPDGGSDYANDVAKALFDMNLRPDLGTSGSSMLTYVLGFVPNSSVDIPYMKSIAANGGGLFGQSNDAITLLNSLTSATVSILSSMSISAPVTFDSSVLSSASDIFWVQYSTLGMTGDLIKAYLNNDGSVAAIRWHFADVLEKTAPSSRFIFTYNKDTLKAVLFKTVSDLSIAQQLDLNTGPTLLIDGLGQQRIDYLRGDRTREIKDFRVRSLILGDVVDSAPVFVGKAINNWPDSAPFPTTTGNKYSDFVNAQVPRTQVIYFGANDGMLHAVKSDNGAEMFAYIPSNLFSATAHQGLHYLTDPAYQHRFYVDLTPTVSDAYVKSRTGGVQWRTILVGGERAGGRGYFALDITDPNKFSAGQENNLLMWEFTSNNDANLGYTYAKPVIALMNNGRWAAIFGNGYNNTGLGKASLFIVFLDGGLTGSWVQGTDYIRIDVGSGSLLSADGLSEVTAVDTNGDGVADRIYAGSVRTGQLWAFDVSSTATSDWKSAYGANPLYTTSGTVSNPMPITGAPIVVKHPTIKNSSSNSPNVMVYFGTGQYLTANDPSNTDPQRLFGVWDRGDGNLTNTNLVQQTFTASGNVRTVSNNPIVYTDAVTSPHGWYISLSGGERSIVSPRLGNTVVIFTTIIPDVSSACSYGGSGWVLAVDQGKGTAPDTPFIDVNGDSIINASDNSNGSVVSGVKFTAGFPSQPSFLQDYMYVPLSNATISKVKVNIPTGTLGRLSVQELTGE